MPDSNGAQILRDLGDNLILRRATLSDAEALVAFNAKLHADEGRTWDKWIEHWVRDLITGRTPHFEPGDFTIVEDVKENKIVSSLNLISQTWTYEGIPFGVGRPELVGTLKEYRKRGLIRTQFETIHAWSAERGEMVQTITGIPYFYRQFGYEMTLTLGGERKGSIGNVPKLKDDEEEPYNVRPAAPADYDFIKEVYAYGAQRWPVQCVRDDAMWQFEFEGRAEYVRAIFSIIETPGGERAGYIAHGPHNWGNTMGMNFFELKEGISWGAVVPCVLRYLVRFGKEAVKRDTVKARAEYEASTDEDKKEPEEKELHNLSFNFGAEHPAYAIVDHILPAKPPTYAWYVRVPDILSFVRHIAPALERRLAESDLAGHTGELKITRYRDAFKMVFEKGKIKAVEPYTPEETFDADVMFPELTFLHVLFGFRTLDELHKVLIDCYAENLSARPLLNALFPKKPSDVWGWM